eukprot:3448764-Rhodomonas_salina.1
MENEDKLLDAGYVHRCTVHGEQYIGFLRSRLARLTEASGGAENLLIKEMQAELESEEAALQWLQQVRLERVNSTP